MKLFLGRLIFWGVATACLHWLAISAGLTPILAQAFASPDLPLPDDFFVWCASAVLALVILLLWIFLRVTARIENILSPRTAPATLFFDSLSVSAIDAQTHGHLDLVITVNLRNRKAVPVKYRGQISAAANGGKSISEEMAVKGTIPPLSKLTLDARIPALTAAAQQEPILQGVFKYDIRYAHKGGVRKRRSTSIISFEMPMPRQAGEQSRERLRTFIVSESDE